MPGRRDLAFSEACWNAEAIAKHLSASLIEARGCDFVTTEQKYFRELTHLNRKPESRLLPIPIPAQCAHPGVHHTVVKIRPVFARRAANLGFLAFAAVTLEPNTPAGTYLILAAGALARATIAIRLLTAIEEERHFVDAQFPMTGNEWKQVPAELQIEVPGSLVTALIAVSFVVVVRPGLLPGVRKVVRDIE
jgi:hypothetical protein